MRPGELPADNHVHTEWSWDAVAGSMEQTCDRAVALGLPSVAFTEHVDYARWTTPPAVGETLVVHGALVGTDGQFDPPPLDVDGYLSCIARCRERYPSLRILTGVELGEPHWFAERSARLLAGGAFDRVLGSLHSVEVAGDPWLVTDLYREGLTPPGWSNGDVVRAYLREALALVENANDFAVLAHVDYPVRGWPGGGDAFDPRAFEMEYRAVLEALARSGRALEVNTTLPLAAEVVRWWREVGGEAVSFGSDAHEPAALARGFADAAAMVEAQGFRPGRHPHDFWRRGRLLGCGQG